MPSIEGAESKVGMSFRTVVVLGGTDAFKGNSPGSSQTTLGARGSGRQEILAWEHLSKGMKGQETIKGISGDWGILGQGPSS